MRACFCGETSHHVGYERRVEFADAGWRGAKRERAFHETAARGALVVSRTRMHLRTRKTFAHQPHRVSSTSSRNDLSAMHRDSIPESFESPRSENWPAYRSVREWRRLRVRTTAYRGRASLAQRPRLCNARAFAIVARPRDRKRGFVERSARAESRVARRWRDY